MKTKKKTKKKMESRNFEKPYDWSDSLSYDYDNKIDEVEEKNEENERERIELLLLEIDKEEKEKEREKYRARLDEKIARKKEVDDFYNMEDVDRTRKEKGTIFSQSSNELENIDTKVENEIPSNDNSSIDEDIKDGIIFDYEFLEGSSSSENNEKTVTRRERKAFNFDLMEKKNKLIPFINNKKEEDEEKIEEEFIPIGMDIVLGRQEEDFKSSLAKDMESLSMEDTALVDEIHTEDTKSLAYEDTDLINLQYSETRESIDYNNINVEENIETQRDIIENLFLRAFNFNDFSNGKKSRVLELDHDSYQDLNVISNLNMNDIYLYLVETVRKSTKEDVDKFLNKEIMESSIYIINRKIYINDLGSLGLFNLALNIEEYGNLELAYNIHYILCLTSINSNISMDSLGKINEILYNINLEKVANIIEKMGNKEDNILNIFDDKS